MQTFLFLELYCVFCITINGVLRILVVLRVCYSSGLLEKGEFLMSVEGTRNAEDFVEVDDMMRCLHTATNIFPKVKQHCIHCKSYMLISDIGVSQIL